MSPKAFSMILIISASLMMWVSDLMDFLLILKSALPMMAAILVIRKIIWMLMVKWPGEKKAKSALMEHKNKFPKAYLLHKTMAQQINLWTVVKHHLEKIFNFRFPLNNH